MLRNVNFLIIAAVVGLLLFLVMNYQAKQAVIPVHNNIQVHDLGMYDFSNSNAFGTTSEADRRWENASVRKEFNQNPFPLAEGCTGCPKKGVANPAGGDTHVCKCGPASKRMIDSMGGNHMLPHMCAPCNGQLDEPSQLGRWFKRKGCANVSSVGLDVRPMCSRC